MSLCPLCKKQADPAFRPFCSKRCKDVDLGRWFNENYSAPCPAEEAPEEDTHADEDASS